ncbi:MAG: endonuclease [Candidatus Azobacteroides sp.]|nr:endonuclease [Candidatus Azobacteroides sp.]
MFSLRYYWIVFLLAISFTLSSQIPAGYYKNIHQKENKQLKTALHRILKNHIVLNYSDLFYYYRTTDVKDDGISVWDMYSNKVRYYSSKQGQRPTDVQREHAFPKSWWAVSSEAEKYAAYSDLNHLFPSDGETNQAKANHMLGEVSRPSFDNGISKVGKNTYHYSNASKAIAFEPADEYKGDFARAYFYIITCYEDYASLWRSEALSMLNNETYPVLKPWARDMLLKWHREDPVSEKEIIRNEEVYFYQNNRNPFIDYPQLVEYIWGDSVNYVFHLPEMNKPMLITPAHLSEIYFGKIQKNSEVAQTIIIKGTSLSGKLSLVLKGTNKDSFDLAASSVRAAAVNSGKGYSLEITYHPQKYGVHNAILTISGGGMDQNIVIYLRGVCSE